MQLTQDSKDISWTSTLDTLCSRQMLYQLSYHGSSAGWVKSYIQSNTTQGTWREEEEKSTIAHVLVVAWARVPHRICWQSYDVQPEGRRPEGLHHNCANISCVALGPTQQLIQRGHLTFPNAIFSTSKLVTLILFLLSQESLYYISQICFSTTTTQFFKEKLAALGGI